MPALFSCCPHDNTSSFPGLCSQATSFCSQQGPESLQCIFCAAFHLPKSPWDFCRRPGIKNSRWLQGGRTLKPSQQDLRVDSQTWGQWEDVVELQGPAVQGTGQCHWEGLDSSWARAGQGHLPDVAYMGTARYRHPKSRLQGKKGCGRGIEAQQPFNIVSSVFPGGLFPASPAWPADCSDSISHCGPAGTEQTKGMPLRRDATRHLHSHEGDLSSWSWSWHM